MSNARWEPPDLSGLPIGTPGYVDRPFPGVLTPERSLTLRQRALLDGDPPVHPLTKGPLHPSAPLDATRSDRFPRPYTCGECVFLTRVPYGSRGGKRVKVELKCGADDGARITKGIASTVPRWWPGCAGWTAR